MTDTNDEARFRTIFAHLGAVTAYAARRGSRDPDGVAAEVMTIAWRRLAAVPTDDPLPWLYGTARNVVYAEARSRRRTALNEIATAPRAGGTQPRSRGRRGPARATRLRP